jgi:hypothetical protein
MAMELHVFSDKYLTSFAVWQRAVDAERFPLRFETGAEFQAVCGFVPLHFENAPSGFECFHDNAEETQNFLGSENFDRKWKFALGFRWRGDPMELLAAWMAATAYAAASDGIIFDHQEARSFTPQEARTVISDIKRDLPRMASILKEIEASFLRG